MSRDTGKWSRIRVVARVFNSPGVFLELRTSDIVDLIDERAELDGALRKARMACKRLRIQAMAAEKRARGLDGLNESLAAARDAWREEAVRQQRNAYGLRGAHCGNRTGGQ